MIEIKDALKIRFKMKELGSTSYFFGIHFTEHGIIVFEKISNCVHQDQI